MSACFRHLIPFLLLFSFCVCHAQTDSPQKIFNDETPPEKRIWEWSLPFYAQKVIDKGFNLPRPYGLSVIYSHLSQNVSINDLQVAFNNTSPLRDIDFIDFGATQVENSTWEAKLDAWVLPFLNLFGILGTVTGTGHVPISIAYRDIFEFLNINVCNGGAPPSICSKNISATAPIDYNGVNVGIGVLIAAGFKDYFFAMPITYVTSDLDVSESNLTSINITPRIGYNYQTHFSGKFGFYVGANYLDSKGYLSGSYTLPLEGTVVGRDVDVRYQLSEHPIDRWNPIVGVNWELSDLWSLTGEIGHSTHRDQQTFVLVYRF